MTWTCNNCGRNQGDRKVVEELQTTGEIVAGDAVQDGDGDVRVPMKEVPGWECDRCGHFHPTPERPPGENP